jgi:dethiobiotin synthetase
LSDTLSVSDLPVLLDLPVVLVVGMRLGCLNHALLTIESIQQAGIKVAGWIANSIDPEFDVPQDNLQTLKSRLDAPCLALIPHLPGEVNAQQRAQLAASINISWI